MFFVEELPLPVNEDDEQMLYDEHLETYICPKCWSDCIYIYKRPVKNLYYCYHCNFTSRGAKGIHYPSRDAEYKFSCDEQN